MYRYIIEDKSPVPPFNEPASLLTIGTTPLKIHQEELFFDLFGQRLELGNTLVSADSLKEVKGTAIVYRDNLWFDKEFLTQFLKKARIVKKACRAAIPADDPAFKRYTLPLSHGFSQATALDGAAIYLLDLWLFPNGYTDDIVPVVIESGAKEKGYYTVPDFMSMEQGDLTHFLPERAVISIESWVHIFYASVVFGVFTRGSRYEEYVKHHNFYALKVLWRGILEMKQVLMSSEVVKVGKNTIIDPSAVITGPTTIGSNCFIGPGAVIDNCAIGDNVNIAQGCQLMLSTVANNCFLPFRASLFMTAVMDSSIIAQNTCLQMCVIGRNSFVGAGSTFTDFNLIAQKPIRAANLEGELESVGQVVLGGAVGHNCRIGAGMIVFPGRMIESDVVLVASPSRRVISRNVTFEESDHHAAGDAAASHKRQYPRPDEIAADDPWEDNW